MSTDNALHIAAKGGNLAVVQSLVSDFDINAKGECDGTALYWSARQGHVEVVKLLLTFNPDVNIPDVSSIKTTCVFPLCTPFPSQLPHPLPTSNPIFISTTLTNPCMSL